MGEEHEPRFRLAAGRCVGGSEHDALLLPGFDLSAGDFRSLEIHDDVGLREGDTVERQQHKENADDSDRFVTRSAEP